MKTPLITLFLFSSLNFLAQSNFNQFKKLSGPEKRWVYSHPFQAKKAFTITKIVLSDVDSLKRSGVIGTDLNGGKLDAFKHAYWMASLTLAIGSKKALKLGIAHEKGNYRQFKKSKLEDAILPDSVSSAMDLHNNKKGAAIVEKDQDIYTKAVQKRIMDLLNEGKLLTIKKDKQGNYLYCEGTFIDMNDWKGKWGIPKCLVPSNVN